MTFTVPVQIRFAHCDLAGIVFYPRYFEIFNSVVEDWCEQGLGNSFKEMHMKSDCGLPLAKVECSFLKPSELGDLLEAQLSVVKIGTTSLHVEIVLIGQDQVERVKASMVLVLMSLTTRKAITLPLELREKMLAYVE